ncbi:Ninjurin [Cinara cedri]|uniref:Ninjurin n=1 Tax=Cinara cedri TaxID=506608 RepID=A0A5E4NRD1_9HEMI|nr:Ninjurin [Cinara cedri]
MPSGAPSYSCQLQSVGRKNDERILDRTGVYGDAVRPKSKPATETTDGGSRRGEMDGVSAKRGAERNGGVHGPGANGAERAAENGPDNRARLEDDGRGLLPSPVADTTDEMIIEEEEEDIPNAFNLYRNKKLISHGMMDVALFSANANQLRYVLESSNGDVIRIICITLLLISIFLQILVGIGLLLSARYNVTNCDQRRMAFKFGNYVIVGIFLITVVNIFITSFGGPSAIPPAAIAASPLTEFRMLNDTDTAIIT